MYDKLRLFTILSFICAFTWKFGKFLDFFFLFSFICSIRECNNLIFGINVKYFMYSYENIRVWLHFPTSEEEKQLSISKRVYVWERERERLMKRIACIHMCVCACGWFACECAHKNTVSHFTDVCYHTNYEKQKKKKIIDACRVVHIWTISLSKRESEQTSEGERARARGAKGVKY